MIAESIRQIKEEMPKGVDLCAAAKTRSSTEIEEAIRAGVRIIGMNYAQEALARHSEVTGPARWHFIGHLQKNKVRDIVRHFDMIETVDSHSLAEVIDRQAERFGKRMEVLIEVNSGREEQKAGVLPEQVVELVTSLADLGNIFIRGLMTMGPFTDDMTELRSCFSTTRKTFNELRSLQQENYESRYLSMGMSDSWRLAVEEGANIIRIGTAIFGART